MKKIGKNILKATIIFAIVFAFVMPASAMINQRDVIKPQNMVNDPIKLLLSKGPGWVEQATGFWEPSRGLTFMHAVDENVVWAAAYDGTLGTNPCREFTKTTNGGEEWFADIISEAPDDGRIAMIYALDENTAWIAMHSGNPQGIWKTSDGGSTWVHQDSAAYNSTGSFPNVVHFWDENNGFCQGDPVDGYYEMYTTTDGGDTWIRVPEENIPEPLGAGEYGTVGYYDVVGDTVWWGTQYSADRGRVFKSTDKGYHWTVADTPFGSGCWVDIRFKDQNNGLAMDKRESTEGIIAETSDGGETWTMIDKTGLCYSGDFDYVPGTDNLYISTGVYSSDPTYQGASFSIDGGHNWIEWTEVSGIQLFATTWVEGIIGWAGSFSQDEYTGGVYKYIPGYESNLFCEGVLRWEEVSGGSTVQGSFIVKSQGEPGSELNWEVSEYPEWGEWTFTPESGTGLPLGDSITVDVEVVVPTDKETEFTGIVKVINSDDSSDSCEIDVYLLTPRNKAVHNPFFLRLFERFPNAFPFLRNLLGF
jgi:photosystem II stability/assembly factor-like uncharacterized protein